MTRMGVGRLWALVLTLLAAPVSGQNGLAGDWVGGLDFGSSWQTIRLHFTPGPTGITGTLDLPGQGRLGLPLKRAELNGSHVLMEWQGNSGLATYDGNLKDRVIAGTFTQGDAHASFRLVHIARIDPAIIDRYVGSYDLGNGHYIDIGTYDLLTFSDTRTGRTGSLYPETDSTFFSGPSAEIPAPIDLRVTFRRNKQGAVSGLVWRETGKAGVNGKTLPHHSEAVTFQNGSTTITGTLILPASGGRHPAIIKVDPGYSSYAKYGFFPYYFVRQGIAFMAITGRSVNGTPVNYEQSTFEERAQDALAGVAFLKARKDINGARIGLHGSSLSSWVVPLAATMSHDVAFVILRVGSALPVQDNILYELESDLRQDNFPEEAIAKAKALRALLNRTILTNTGWDTLKAQLDRNKDEDWFGYARVGWMRSRPMPPDSTALRELRAPISYDPLPVLEKLRVPVLAFNGELDRAVNTKVSVPIMREALRKAGNKDFTIVVLPAASHDLLEARTGYNSEYPYLKRHAPGYWDTMSVWLRKHAFGGK